MATHSSVLAWRIPGMGEPGGLPSMGSHRVGHDWGDLAAAAAKHWEVRVCVCARARACVCVRACVLSRVWFFATPCHAAAHKTPLSVEFFQPRILEWVAISNSRYLPNPGTEPISLASPALAGRFFTTTPPGKHMYVFRKQYLTKEVFTSERSQIEKSMPTVVFFSLLMSDKCLLTQPQGTNWWLLH